jgi:hypothetical protein
MASSGGIDRRPALGGLTQSAPRAFHLDHLRVLLVAGVIFGHAWAGYSTVGSWAYTDAREVTLAPLTETLMEVPLGPFALFAVGMLLFIAGLLTPGSVARKGPGRFARDRLLRLGIPLAVFTLVLWPPVAYALNRLSGRTESLGSAFRDAIRSPDPVHLWFLVPLLVFSLAYAAWCRHRPPPPGPATGPPGGDRPGGLTIPRLLALSAAVAGASFLIRLWFPLNTSQFLGLHLNQLPQHLALFGLGLVSAHRGWLDPVPDRLRRGCGYTALLGTLAVAAFAGVAGAGGAPVSSFLGGWHWPSLATAAVEGLLAVHLSVWLLAHAQRHLHRPGPVTHAARHGYGAYLLQGHVLVALALLLRPVQMPAELKALAVSVLGVLASFWIARIAVTRTRLGRLL